MSSQATDRVFTKVTIPDTVNGTNSRAFTIPKGAKTMTIHAPSLTSSATLKIQALDPQDNDQASDTFRDLSAVVIASAIAFCALATIPGNAATSIPVAALASGPHRFVASAAQTGVVDNETILVSFGFDG